MRILLVHNYYKIRGGEDAVCEAEFKLLQAHGHEVHRYTAHNEQLEAMHPLQSATNTIWSRSTYNAVKQILQQKAYDIVHVHNFLPLISPAVYYAAQEQKVPVVQTLHNYRLLCPNALFFRDGQVCEACQGKTLPWPGVYHGCYRESRVATGVVAAMNSIHAQRRTWTTMVDTYIALTAFVRQKYIDGGIPAQKIKIKPNFVDPDPGIGEGKGHYALYVGRLSVEKGLDVLLETWQTIGARLPLKIVGDGPLAKMVVQAMQENPAIEWVGRKPMEEVYLLMGNATALIFPSKWYETFGLVAIEAFAKGTPVIAANIGAIAELIDPGRTGLLFEPSNPQALAKQVESILSESSRNILKMRQEAREEYELKYTASKNHQTLINIYQNTVSS